MPEEVKNSLFQTDTFQQKFLTKLLLIDNQLTTAKTFAFVTYAEQMECWKYADVYEEDSSLYTLLKVNIIVVYYRHSVYTVI